MKFCQVSFSFCSLASHHHFATTTRSSSLSPHLLLIIFDVQFDFVSFMSSAYSPLILLSHLVSVCVYFVFNLNTHKYEYVESKKKGVFCDEE